MMSYQIFSGIIVFLLLVCDTITDLRFKEITLKLSAVAFVALLSGQFYYLGYKHVLINLGAGLLLFGIMLINALINKSGGDCILMGIIGFSFGAMRGLIALIVSCICMTLFYFFFSKKQKDYPMVPFILIGTLFVYFI